MKKLIISIFVISLAFYGIYRILGPENSAGAGRSDRWLGRDRSLSVIIEPVILKPIKARLEAIGTSRAIKSALILPRVGGEVTRVAFAAGDKVDQGQILIELDQREEKLALELTKVRYDLSLKAYQRRAELTEKGTITAAALDEAKSARDEARIAFEQARIALADRIVRAPFSGYVGATDIDVGDRVTPTTEITSLDDRSSLLVRFDAPERFITRLGQGQKITLDPFTGNTAPPTEAEIVDLGSRVDSLNRTFPARARLDNRNDFYRPGQSFRVRLDTEGALYPAVPEVALLWGSDGAYVWKVSEGKAKQVSATVVARQGGFVLIDSDLQSQDQIITEGVQRVRADMSIKSADPFESGIVLESKPREPKIQEDRPGETTSLLAPSFNTGGVS